MTRFVCIALLGIVAACHVSDVDYTGKSCPCPGGYSCDVSTDTCTRGPIADAAADTASTPDTPPDAPDGCFGVALVTACPSPGWPSTLVLSTAIINTDNSLMCVPAQLPSSCVIVADAITVPLGATFAARGSRTLVLVGTASITVDGTLDVASHQGDTVGAGGNSASCGNATPPGTLGGGAGGSFAGTGGTGGMGNGSVGGIAASSVATVTLLRGGCAGSAGGGTGGGVGGHGGGAVYLIAPGSIAIDGTIDASGAGGTGATVANVGGGGGGAGGFIGIDTPTLTVQNSATLYANGGGGAAGTDATPPANDGSDPSSPSVAAPGGVGDTTGARTGGTGSVGSGLDGGPGHDSNGTGGGGGGGGGAGFIKLYPMRTIGGAVSPPSS